MKKIRKSADRGYADRGWLKSWHTFSFADYHDPEHMAFGFLRVINEDIIKPAQGFPTHGHRDMEIITYVISGILEHKDSMGNTGLIKPGEVQRMSAGTGVTHSEFNHLKDQDTHLLQIWILPDQSGRQPEYEQKSFADALKSGELVLVASQEGRAGSVSLNQNTALYVCKTASDRKFVFKCQKNKNWIQVVNGEVWVDEIKLQAGDGLASSGLSEFEIAANSGSEFLLFDMA